MDIQVIKDCLRPWLQIDTWHTGHPLDEQRFHRALQNCFDRIAMPIGYDSFREAMDDVADELHPQLSESFKVEAVERCASHAERISEYLADTGQLGKPR